jgi:hypothetical protein
MLLTLLHGGDLGLEGWIFILLFLGFIAAIVIAAFVGLIYLIGKRWPPIKATPTTIGNRDAEQNRHE